MVVLVRCLTTFTFDRKLFAINEAIFSNAAFERNARVNADPVDVTVVLESLNSLRIYSVLSFFTRIGTNLSLCFQCVQLASESGQCRRHVQNQKSSSLYPYRHPVALLFVLLPIAVVVYVSKSIGTSQLACSYHSECAVHAFRWISVREGDRTQCPCLTLVDTDQAPRTYTEWLNPRNATEKVAQLATSGDLRAILLTNRLLSPLPQELQRCTNMKHMYVRFR